MGEYLIDNNVISNYFSESYSEKGMDFISEIINKTPNISVITQIEALSWISKDKNKETILREFINDAIILGLTDDIVHICVKIRRSKKIKTPDAIISATAIANNLTLLSSDSDFIGIQNLKIINPDTI